MYSDKDKSWKIADFGLTSEGTTTGPRFTELGRGKRCYTAPELLRDPNLSFNKKVDIWSLGCILHELCTGKKAFAGDGLTIEYFRSKEPFHVDVSIHELPSCDSFTELIRIALDADCSKRPSARIMHTALAAISESVSLESSDTALSFGDSGLDFSLSKLSISQETTGTSDGNHDLPTDSGTEFDKGFHPERTTAHYESSNPSETLSRRGRQFERDQSNVGLLSETRYARLPRGVGDWISGQSRNRPPISNQIGKAQLTYIAYKDGKNEVDVESDTKTPKESVIPFGTNDLNEALGRRLSPQDAEGNAYEEIFLQAYRKLTSGTCQWVIEHPEFQDWFASGNGKVLWINGGSGCGKTMAMAFLAKHLRNSENVRVIHQFCRRSLKAVEIIRSLILQLWSQSKREPESNIFWRKVDQTLDGITPDERFWKELFVNTITHLSALYSKITNTLVLDAVDECQDGDRLLNWLLDISRGTKIHLMLVVSSRRPNVAFEHLLQDTNNIIMDQSSIMLNQADIFQSAHDQLWEGVVFGRLDGFSKDFIWDIAMRISREAQGM
jgi:serine/threonine protein kinase